jgi:iron complex outermembrane receptor protein
MKSFLFILFSFVLLNQTHGQCILSISGKVRDIDAKSFLQGANVFLVETKKTVVTDKDGKFQLSGLCPGDYTLRISHADCQSQDIHLHLKEDIIKDIDLPHAENILKEVVVVGAASVRSEGITGELRGKELASTRGLTLGESLQKITGVTVLQTGNNIYKPVIQGLHSSRVLILNNGIRQEGQQWGSEHAPEIDPYIANRLTVIKGAASVRYGGDAIGGVILVEPRLLQYSNAISGEVNMAAFSNNRQGVLSAMAEGGFDKNGSTAWRLQGSVKRGGNAKTPEYWLKNSGVEEINMSATAGWRKERKGIEFFYSLFNTKIGIFTGSHLGNLTDLENVIKAQTPPDYIRDERFSYLIERPYQSVQHHLAKLKLFSEKENRYRLGLTFSSQMNIRKEFDITRSSTTASPQLEMNLFTNMADLVWEHFSNKKVKGSVGLNAMHQVNYINYRYFIPNYQSVDLGIWVAEKYQLNSWQFEVGLRYDHKNRFGITDNDEAPYDVLMGNSFSPGEPYGKKVFSGFSGTGVAAYKFSNHLRISMTTSTAWRSPQVNELFSNGLHHGAARIERGDVALKPERAWSVMGALLYSIEKLELDFGFYNKQINGFIYLNPSYPPLLTIRGAFPTFNYAQTDAVLSGADFSMAYLFGNHVKSHLKGSVLRAYNSKAKTWLIQMPADRFEGQLEYLFVDGKKLKQSSVQVGLQHVTKQTRVPPTGNIKITSATGVVSMASDYMAPPPAYSLINFDANTSVVVNKRMVGLILSVNNLLNTSYRDYMNSFRYFCLDRGRNISLKAKISL